MFKLIPMIFALSAVQRHTAASVSTRPLRREQQGFTAGEPTTTLTKSSTSAQTPNFNVSFGHLLDEGVGEGFGCGLGFGLGEGQVPQALIRVKKRMLNARKRANIRVGVLLLMNAILYVGLGVCV